MRTYHKNPRKPVPEVPSWTQILTEAVGIPGRTLEAYTAFHDYVRRW